MTETVDCFIPISDGLPFPIAEACISIRPNEDEAFPWGIAAEVLYQDPFTDKWHAIPEKRADQILADIRKNDREKWSAIQRAAQLNSRPDYEDGGYDDYDAPAFEAMEITCPR